VALKDESDVLEIGGDDAKMQIERP